MGVLRRCSVALGMYTLVLCGTHAAASASAAQSGITVHVEQCQTALEKTLCTLAAHLDSLRDQARYWDGPLETDPTCDAVVLVLAAKLGKSSPSLRQETLERIFTWKGRRPDGWAAYPGGPYDQNTTAIMLLALQAIGLGREHAELTEAWKTFERSGGVAGLTVTSRLFLDALGLHPHHEAPVLSPKIVALSKVLPVNVFKLGILRSVIIPQIGLKYYQMLPKAPPLPKAVLQARGSLLGHGLPMSPLEETHAAPFLAGTPADDPAYYMTPDFLHAAIVHSDEFWAQEIVAWTLKLQQSDGTWYALASTINSILLLREAQAKGMADFSPEIDAAWNGLMQSRRKSQQGPLFVQTIRSTVWDTANALSALLNVNPTLVSQPQDRWQQTATWILQHQFPAKDMLPGRDGTVPKAWSFSHLDSVYLDSDDTSAMLNTLWELHRRRPETRLAQAMASAVEWLVQLQNEDGGFPSWNRGMSKGLLHLMGPSFNDLAEIADTSQADVTARVLYVLTRLAEHQVLPAYAVALHTSMAQACAFLKRSAVLLPDQRTPVWFGDWAVNYVYGTAFATMSLLHGKCWRPSDAVPSVQWLLATQQANGGWGESPESYKHRAYVPAPPTIFQTASALLALIEYHTSAQEPDALQAKVRSAIDQGIAYLVQKTHFGRDIHEETYTAVVVKGQMFVNYYLSHYYFHAMCNF